MPPSSNTRWRLPVALMVTLFIGYLDRTNISLALPLMAREYGWSAEQVHDYGSQLLGLFYVGYGIANIFLSPLAARIGPRRSLMTIIVLWALFTALGALLSASMLALIATRVLLGLAEGVHFPMMSLLTKRWFPPAERSRANSIWIAGLLLAICLSPVILVPLMNSLGWYAGFLLLAGGGLLISLPIVARFVHDTPAASPWLAAEEKTYIAAENQKEAAAEALTLDAEPGLRRAMLQPMMLVMILAGTLNNVVSMGIALWLPTYFVSNKGLDYADLIYASSLPYIMGVVGVGVWSWLGDRYNARAVFSAAGIIAASGFLWMAFNATSITLSVAWLCAGVFAISAYPACEFALLQRVLPASLTGQGTGIYNGLTTMIGGGSGPVVVSAVIGTQAGAGGGQEIWVICVICLLMAGLMGLLAWRLRY